MVSEIPRFNLSMRQPTELIPHLGKGEAHWKEGRSAKSLCLTWWQANGIPKKVRQVFAARTVLKNLKLVDGFFERLVDLGDNRRPSQTDLLAICSDDQGLIVVAVEGKVDETFGPFVHEWRDGSPAKEARLELLCGQLGLPVQSSMPLRYQLLHRTASGLIEAARYKTSRAVMLVHSFCPTVSGFDDYSRFSKALGYAEPRADEIVGPRLISGMELFLGWVSDVVPIDVNGKTQMVS